MTASLQLIACLQCLFINAIRSNNMSFFSLLFLLFSFLYNFGLSVPSGLPYLIIMIPYFLSHITSSFTMSARISTWGAQLTQFTSKKPCGLFFLKISINKIQRGWEPGCMLWFNFILGINFIFLCFKLIIIHHVHYHT